MKDRQFSFRKAKVKDSSFQLAQLAYREDNCAIAM